MRIELAILPPALVLSAMFLFVPLAPGDARLVWDRLPMTLVFIPLLGCVVSGESDSRSSRRLLAFLVTCGVSRVSTFTFS